MRINIRKSAIKDLKRIDHKNKKIIHLKILELAKFPTIANRNAYPSSVSK